MKPTQTSLSRNAEPPFTQTGELLFALAEEDGRHCGGTKVWDSCILAQMLAMQQIRLGGVGVVKKGGFRCNWQQVLSHYISVHSSLKKQKKQLDAVADLFCSEAKRRPPFGRLERTGKGTGDKGKARE